MRAFILGVVAAGAIAAGAWMALDQLGWSSAARYSSNAVRL